MSESVAKAAYQQANQNKEDISGLAGDGRTPEQTLKGAYEALGNKVDKVQDKGLSTNDYTDEEKQKVADNGSLIASLTQDVNAHMAEIATLRFSPEATEYTDIFSLPSTVVQGTMKGKLKGAIHQNLVKNGNFADGTTGWSATGGTMSVSNGNLVFEASPVAEEHYHYVLQALPIPIAGHKYYFTAKNLANVEWSIIIYNFNGDGQYESVPSPIIQTSGSLSVCITPSSVNATPYFFIRLYCKTGETANFDDVQVYDLTAEGLTTLTDAQLAQKFSNYIDGMQSVQPQEITSVGKNKFNLYAELERINPDNVHLAIEDGRNCVKVTYPVAYYQGKILEGLFKPLTQYTFTLTYKHIGTYGGLYINIRYADGEVVETMDGTVGSFRTTVITSAAGRSIQYLELSYGGSNEITYFDIDICQAEKGTTATTYEPYQENKTYLKYPLRSVPNGIADEVDLQSGKLTKRCEEYVLQASDIAGIASYSTLDYVQLNKPIDFVGYNNLAEYNNCIVVPGFIGKYPIGWDNALNIGGFFNQSAALIAFLGVPKGTYADLAAAQAALAGTKIVYQLAQEQVVEDALSNQLTVYPSGTVSNKAKKQYVLKAEDITQLITSATNLDVVTIAKRTDYTLYGSTANISDTIDIGGYLNRAYADTVDNIGAVFAYSMDTFGLGFVKGTYATLAEAQADLAGTIITYDTKPELSTIPVTVHSEPINLAGAVKSESDRNTRQDEQINDITLLLDYLIVVNA